MGGQLVFLPDRKHDKGCAMQYKLKKHVHVLNAFRPRGRLKFFDNEKLPASFHLPETCRQVYAETVLTAYEQNDFFLESCHLRTKSSMARLMVAQRRAITSVLSESNLLVRHMTLKYPVPATKFLPNLKVILVTKLAIVYLEHRLRKYPMTADLHDLKAWQAWILQKFKDSHGDRVEIRFEDDA